jgi:hypothetical protein
MLLTQNGGNARNSTLFLLKAGAVRSMSLHVALEGSPRGGQFTALQIRQYRKSDDRLVGSLGVIARSER